MESVCIFDFTNSYFGDPIADLIKYLIIFIDQGEIEMAKTFVQNYLGEEQDLMSYKKRLKLYMIQ